jgi:hypothetical protein
MRQSVFRIHPAIGVARVGNSEEYYLAPETMAGFPAPGEGTLMGGLPIRPGTESETVRSSELRDNTGALKRQAARFRIYGYPAAEQESWPTGGGSEVTIGSKVDGRTVSDIVWSVHVANKKANTFLLVEADGEPQGIDSFRDGRLPPIRNAQVFRRHGTQPPDPLAVLNDPARVRQLTIDPGPRTVTGRSAPPVRFDAATVASYLDVEAGTVVQLAEYPKSFPGDTFQNMESPAGAIDTLGQIETDEQGRLIVAGGYGRASGWRISGTAPLIDDVNNDQWFDDTSDGPVTATLVFDDGTRSPVAGAWVTTTDPSYAPQILNSVSLWDDIYDVWVRLLRLAPEIYDANKDGYQDAYLPTFDDQIYPIFKAASLQQWVVNLDPMGRSVHDEVSQITADTDPSATPLSGLTIFRDPDEDDQYSNPALMPAALGDANQSFLALRKTQYFFLQRWNEGHGHYRPGQGAALGPGERLDKAVLVNCLGGRFSPGIDLTFVVREPSLYIEAWEKSGSGPFRIHRKPLPYASVDRSQPLLGEGYVPLHVDRDGLEPGDLSKWMALPWHTDYNSCSTHPPSPNPPGNRTVFWSWPAQRPVAVFAAEDVTMKPGPEPSDPPIVQLGKQRWSVRGEGTDSPRPENWGRYQPPILQMVENWSRIGTVLQGPAIETLGAPLASNWYLEAESQLIDTGSTPVEPFPNQAWNLDDRAIYFQMLNVDQYPEALPDARAFVDKWLEWSEKFSLDPSSPDDQQYFPYSEQAFAERLDLIYQELVDQADQSDPGNDRDFKTYEDVITRTVQLAPFNLLDGAWLRGIAKSGPIDEVRALVYSIYMDEQGDGDVSHNHCNIYLDLCHSLGYYPPPVDSREFAFDPQLLQSAFTVPAFELAISQFSEDYYPEILGMTLQLEWEVVDLKPTRDLLEYFGIDPHFYVMHIGIDNAVNGHGQRAADAVRLYLQGVDSTGGEAAVQAAWRRIWNGFVAFGNIGTFGEDLERLLHRKPSLREQLIAMIERKAEYGNRNHQDRTVGATRINEWFADPPGFLDALVEHAWITAGDWQNSRLQALLEFQGGPMYRVFDDDEIALWAAYTQSLVAPPEPPSPAPPPPSPESAGAAMSDLIDRLRPVQQGIPGHATNMLADTEGTVHPLAWWFTQPTSALMEALSSEKNDVIIPGRPQDSPFYTELTAPTGPMGDVFALAAGPPPTTKTNHQVVYEWIATGCPIPAAPVAALPAAAHIAAPHLSLWLNTPPAERDVHPTGRIYGMGTIH